MSKFSLIHGVALGNISFFLLSPFFTREIQALINAILLYTCAALLTITYLLYHKSIRKLIAFYQKAEQAIADLENFPNEYYESFIRCVDTVVVAMGTNLLSSMWTFVDWFRSIFRSSDDDRNGPAADGRERERLVFVVSLHRGHTYKSIKSTLRGRDDPHVFVDWNSNSNSVEELPSPAGFVRHFAVCLVPLHDWNDNAQSLIHKLENGVYWELPRPRPVPEPCDGVSWTIDKIQGIDGIKLIGHTTYDNEAISEQFYRPLRAGWELYETIWWNSFDFATRLACMILPDEEPKSQLRQIIMAVRASRDRHIRAKGFLDWSGWSGWSPIVLAPLALNPTTMAPLVMSVVAIPIVGLVSGLFRNATVEMGNMLGWKLRSKELEEIFVSLVGLVDHL